MTEQVYIYGVFILRDGAWVEWATYRSFNAAEREVGYLVTMLGVPTKLFRKVA